MTRLASVLLLLFGLGVVPAAARPVSIPSGNPVVGVDIPEGWTTTPSKRGIAVKSPDKEVFFWIEVFLPADREAVIGEHERYFAKQDVRTTGEPKSTTSKHGPVTFTATDYPATWKGGPTVLRYLAIDPGLPAGNRVLLSYWASPEGDKMHDAAFKTILESLGPPQQ